MHKKFKIDKTKIKGSCQLERKVITHGTKCDLPLVLTHLDFAISLWKGPNPILVQVLRPKWIEGHVADQSVQKRFETLLNPYFFTC